MTSIRVRPAITNATARKMVEAAVAAAETSGGRFSIAVVDESGHLNAFARMDGAGLMSAQIAQDKAYTAAAFGMSTDQWHDAIKNDPPLAMGAVSGIDRLVVFGGGLPIIVDGEVVGGIGVSGGHWSQDVEIAKAGMEIV